MPHAEVGELGQFGQPFSVPLSVETHALWDAYEDGLRANAPVIETAETVFEQHEAMEQAILAKDRAETDRATRQEKTQYFRMQEQEEAGSPAKPSGSLDSERHRDPRRKKLLAWRSNCSWGATETPRDLQVERIRDVLIEEDDSTEPKENEDSTPTPYPWPLPLQDIVLLEEPAYESADKAADYDTGVPTIDELFVQLEAAQSDGFPLSEATDKGRDEARSFFAEERQTPAPEFFLEDPTALQEYLAFRDAQRGGRRAGS